jgi:hypothetical protein
MNVLVLLAAILVQTGLPVWLEARSCRTLRSIDASHIDARPTVIGARFMALDAERNGGAHVAVGHPRLIEMRE